MRVLFWAGPSDLISDSGSFLAAERRHAEFARAAVSRILEGLRPKLVYYGLLRAHQKDVITSVETIVFQRLTSKQAYIFCGVLLCLRPTCSSKAASPISIQPRHWDSLPSSPPKSRPRPQTQTQITGLQLLSCDARGQPHFPDRIPGEVFSRAPKLSFVSSVDGCHP